MSALSGISSSAGSSYATQLAQTSAFERSLYNLGSAVQNGNLTTAGSILSALMKANPQYAAASSGNTADSQDPINQDFQNLANAISNNQADTARSAWSQLKNDLAQNGITNISSGADLAAQAVAQSQISMEQSVLTNLFGVTSDTSPSVASLLGGSANSITSTDSVGSLVSNWLTYEADGNSSSPTGTGSGGSLNTVA